MKDTTVTNITTDVNLDPSDSKTRKVRYSVPSLSTMNGYITEEAKTELRFPNSVKLYKQMSLDPNVSAATGAIKILIGRVDWSIEVPDDAPEEEKERCEKLNYNLGTTKRPFQEYISEFLSYLLYGFSAPEKIYTKIKDSPVGDFVGWKDFKIISQDTVGQWLFDRKSGDLLGLRQDTSRIDRGGMLLVGGNGESLTGYTDVPRKKFLLFRNSPDRDNPEGTSPLRSCYTSWKYKTLVEEYESIGVTKDLG